MLAARQTELKEAETELPADQCKEAERRPRLKPVPGHALECLQSGLSSEGQLAAPGTKQLSAAL